MSSRTKKQKPAKKSQVLRELERKVQKLEQERAQLINENVKLKQEMGIKPN